MDFAFSQSMEDVAGLARRIFAEHPAVDETRRWRLLAEAGLLGAAVPEEQGGSGGGLLELCALLEEQGRATAEAPLWAALACAGLAIAERGTPAQRRRWLPPLAAGESLLTAAFVDADGDDALRPAATAVPDGAGWRVRGVKLAVPAAARARRVLVPASAPDGEAVLLLVDPHGPGVTLAAQTLTTGETAYQLALDWAPVDAEDVLPGGRAGLERTVMCATAALCALQLGVAERALAMTASYTAARQQFGRPIATFQAVAHRAADAYIDVEAIRLCAWRAAWLLAERRDDEARAAVAVAKVWACEAGHRVTCAAQHLHGGIGFDVSYPLGRSYLWSKQIELTLGPAGSHLARLGAALGGTP